MGNSGTYAYDKMLKEWVKVSDKSFYPPDVYFKKEYFEPHFAVDGSPYGQQIRSRRHKAEIMKNLGIRETGDRVHGGY